MSSPLAWAAPTRPSHSACTHVIRAAEAAAADIFAQAVNA